MGRVLAVIDRAFRGTVEAQYVHCLYVARELHRQFGLELALRGLAVTFAVGGDPGGPPRLELGSSRLDELPDYRGSVRTLLDDGVTVHVDGPDLQQLRLDPVVLLPGVRCTDTNLLARRWPTFEGIWFL